MVSAVIISSGKATRLGNICEDKPKCLLTFESVPFLRYLLSWLINNGISDIVVTGSRDFHADMIEKEIRNNFPSSVVSLVTEDYPRSTTYSSYFGVKHIRSSNTLILTADNIWDVNLKLFIDLHLKRNSNCSVLVTTRTDVPNFGLVKIDPRSGRILSLHDPESSIQGVAASTMGLYAVRKDLFLNLINPESDIFVERESIQRLAPNIWSVENNKFFFDFGTPENYQWLSNNPEILIKYFGEPILK